MAKQELIFDSSGNSTIITMKELKRQKHRIKRTEKKNERSESLYHKEQHVLCVHLSNLSTPAICHSEGKITFAVRVKV